MQRKRVVLSSNTDVLGKQEFAAGSALNLGHYPIFDISVVLTATRLEKLLRLGVQLQKLTCNLKLTTPSSHSSL